MTTTLTAAEALALAARKPGGKCPVGIALDKLTDDDRAVMDAALERSATDMPHAQVQRAFKTLAPSVTIGIQAVPKHRAGACACH